MVKDTAVEAWLALRKETGLKIDPEMAEVMWMYGQIMDPYGVRANLPDECQQVGRVYFARSPESDVWVSFHDLPVETAKRLWERLDGGAIEFSEMDDELWV